MKKYDLVVVEFISSQCGEPCSNLENNLYNISQDSARFQKEFNKTIYFSKVNAEADERFTQKFNILKYPSLYVLYDKYENKFEMTNFTNLSTDTLYNFIDE